MSASIVNYGGTTFRITGSWGRYVIARWCQCDEHPAGHWDEIARATTKREALRIAEEQR